MHLNGHADPGAPRLAPLLARAPKRVLFFGKNMSRTRCTGALAEALRRHGLDVKWLNMATLRRWLQRPLAERAARWVHQRFRPDLIFVFCRDLPKHLLEEFGKHTPVVLWVEEPLHDVDAEQVRYFAAASLVCMSNPGKFRWLREQGLSNMAFVMSGFSPTFHHPVEPRRPIRDLVFIGGPGFSSMRAEFLAEISQHYRTEIFGPKELWASSVARYPQLRVRDAVGAPGYREVCATSRIVLGLNQVNEDPLYFSNRTFLTLACRGFHLTHYVPGLETVFQDGEHLAWYVDPRECLAKIERYLDADAERERIAANGHDLVVARHQYYHRIDQILAMLRGDVPATKEPVVVLETQPRLAPPSPLPAARAAK